MVSIATDVTVNARSIPFHVAPSNDTRGLSPTQGLA